jgi:D-glycero-D-manno-heptose 1,7-bisphosphate phosphatase
VSNSSEASLPGRQGLPKSKPLRTVFLDRDGVINRKMPEGQYVTGWQHFDLLPGVAEAIAKLNHAGLRVLVVTNQRGIALGLYSVADVEHIHQQLQLQLSLLDAHIDGFYFCPHDKRECGCRKPLPGLFEQARATFPDTDPGSSLIIGDSLSDIEFGRNLGMGTIFLEGDEYARQHQKAGGAEAVALADCCFATLPDAVDSLMQTQSLRIGA